MPIAPTSLLEAVNIILDGIGEAGVNTLVSSNADVNKAIQRIDEASRAVQTPGLWFNTEFPTLSPDSGGEYVLPTNTLSVRIADAYKQGQFVQRGFRLYDRTNSRFDGNTDDLCVELTVLVPFEELPEEARMAIFTQAARKFADRVIGSTTLHQLLVGDEGRAAATLFCKDMEQERRNYLNSPDAGLIFDRGRT